MLDNHFDAPNYPSAAGIAKAVKKARAQNAQRDRAAEPKPISEKQAKENALAATFGRQPRKMDFEI